jgi:uncharacterized damage-inducible protein DinB
MEDAWRDALWPQFGAAIDMLDQAVAPCPDALWDARVWPDVPEDPESVGSGRFWVVIYHTLFWLDAYLSGSVEDYTPPAPFAQEEGDRAATRAEPYTKDQLRGWLTSVRRRAHATLAVLTDEQARRPFEFPWRPGQPISYLELQLYNMRHIQEHAAHLSLLLGQHGLPPADLDWISYAGEHADS